MSIIRRSLFLGRVQKPNEIWYTSSDNNSITPTATGVFGANITSNTYGKGLGIIEFDGPVTSIGASAFDGCSTLTSIRIPSGVTSLGKYSFRQTGLTGFNTSTITTFGDGVFSGCTSLSDVVINSAPTSFPNYLFKNCSSLSSVNIPSTVTTFGNSVFKGCTSLVAIEIPENLSTIGTEVFYGCTSLQYFMGDYSGITSDKRCLYSGTTLKAFAPAELTSYEIPSTFTVIDVGVFGESSLVSVTIPSSITSIGNNAYLNCSSLANVACNPTTVPTLGTTVFDGNASGRLIYVDGDVILDYKAATNWSTYEDYIVTLAEKTITTAMVGSGTVTGGGSYMMGTSVTLTATPASGYRFNSWADDGSTSLTKTVIVMDDITITANFEALVYHSVGDIAYWDGSALAYTPYTSWSSSLGTAVGVCVVPTTHAEVWGDGRARFLALKSVTSSGTASSSEQKVSWGTSSSIPGLTSCKYGPVWSNVSGGSVSRQEGALLSYFYEASDALSSGTRNVYDTSARYYSSPYAVGPYLSDGSFNTDFITALSGGNAFADLDGKYNTSKILAKYSSAEAAKGCNRYSTSGISAGNWYLPSEGELMYVVSRMGTINSALSAVGGLTLLTDYRMWSSTQQDSSNAWGIGANGMLICGIKTYDAYVRPVCMLN